MYGMKWSLSFSARVQCTMRDFYFSSKKFHFYSLGFQKDMFYIDYSYIQRASRVLLYLIGIILGRQYDAIKKCMKYNIYQI